MTVVLVSADAEKTAQIGSGARQKTESPDQRAVFRWEDDAEPLDDEQAVANVDPEQQSGLHRWVTERHLSAFGASPEQYSLMFVQGTTESTTSEEDQVPPPLPAKQRESDYCNLPDGVDKGRVLGSTGAPKIWNRMTFPEGSEKPATPPTPPPKPKTLPWGRCRGLRVPLVVPPASHCTYFETSATQPSVEYDLR